MIDRLLKKIKKIINPKSNKNYDELGLLTMDGISLQDYVHKKIISREPFMLSRFGSVELDSLVFCLNSNIKSKFFRKFFFLFDKINSPNLSNEEYIKQTLVNNAGFFPYSRTNLNLFTEIYLDSIKNIDVLGSWRPEEKYVRKYMKKDLILTKLGNLEPYKFQNPWSEALKGKKVLVVHPFEESIKEQYNNYRSYLFSNKKILQDFQLLTIKAVQSIAGEKTCYESWFDALSSMKTQIEKVDFDIAIIGCGAYGLPLASYVKSIGKQAIHLGGATQILFGIKGKRWEERDDFKVLFNEYWKYPLDTERPPNCIIVENACYW